MLPEQMKLIVTGTYWALFVCLFIYLGQSMADTCQKFMKNSWTTPGSYKSTSVIKGACWPLRKCINADNTSMFCFRAHYVKLGTQQNIRWSLSTYMLS